MKKIIFTILFAVVAMAIYSQKKVPMNYENQWRKVEDLEGKSLPKSAQAEVDAILRQAVVDKNSPQIIKALIHQAKYETTVDWLNNTVVFDNLNEMLAKSSDGVEQAVLHSMLGELYYDYFSSDMWAINERTRLKGIVPEDMKEWSSNIFFDKMVEHFAASVEQRKLLEGVDVKEYAAVIVEGEDSRRLYPTFYDFLMRRATDNLSRLDSEKDMSILLARKGIEPESLFASAKEYGALNFDIGEEEYGLRALEMYRLHLVSLNERGLDESVMLTELDKMDFLRRMSSAHNTYALPALERMLKQWRDKIYSVEIAAKMAELYANELRQQQDMKEMERKTEALYAFLKSEIERNPKYNRIGLLENRLLELTRPQFDAAGEGTYVPGAKKELTINYKNVRGAKASLYRVESPVELFQSAYYGVDKKLKRTLVKSWQVDVPQLEPYKSGEMMLVLDVDEMGSYMLEFEPQSDYNVNNGSAYHFVISDLAVFSRLAEENRYEFYVVNRVSGEPVQDATVNIYKLPGSWRTSKLTLDVALRTDASGLAVYEKKIPNNDVFYQVMKGTDSGSSLNNLVSNYYYSNSSPSDESREQVAMFTDRSLYRPGQMVYFKAIASVTEGGRASVVANKKLEVILRDANGREVSKQTLTTNEYGSTAGEFVLPQGTLNGQFSIATDKGSVYFRVEEYKRPTFEVSFDKIEETYKFGEEITLKGRAENYSGVKLQGASVKYSIQRIQMWGRIWGVGSGVQFAEGMAVTNDNGEFEIRFTPQKSDTESYARQIYSFMVEAEVTDLNGETQVGNYTVMVGDVSMMLSIDLADKVNKESEVPIVIGAMNLDGKEIEAKGSYSVCTVQENDSIGKQVLNGVFETGEQPQLKQELDKLASGKYRIKLKSKDDSGNEVEAESDFVLFSYADKRPPIETNEWLLKKRTTFAKSIPAEIILGVSDKDVHVLYELYRGNDLLERKWMRLSNENRLFRVDYKDEYKEGVTLFLTYVKDERFYSHYIGFTAERERKELDVRLDVFRDKIRPGGDEEWRISVRDAKGNAALAEVLASMYDFSLDQIYRTSPWVLNSGVRSLYRSVMQLSSDRSFFTNMSSLYFGYESNKVANFIFDRFNWFGYSLEPMLVTGYSLRSSVLNEKVVVGYGRPVAAAPQADMAERELRLESVEDMEVEQDASQSRDDNRPQVRRNFDEMAFFFPQLRTNEAGETLIAFKVPDSNTKWRFRVLAHDKEMNSGQTEAFTVSQKELMVTPNLPRFLRHGDRTSISTKISNLSDGALSGSVRLEFFNVLTDEVSTAIVIEDQVQEFALGQGASGSAVWTFDVPSDIELLGVRIVAESDGFSDGEQHALAVLPNKMLVTESIRMDVDGSEDKKFVFDRLANQSSETRTDYRLTLEFTSNPAWYAVQALPVLGNPDSDNAVSWFAAYYANTLGVHIGKTYPKVAAMVEAWKKQGGTKETLLSNLEKNEELKNVLLEETPWVLEAKNETEQKEKLALLFDLNHTSQLTKQALDKLQELQHNQGGWTWFKGFYPNVGITHYILYGFTQLENLSAIQLDGDLRGMQLRGVNFIDQEALRRFEQLKKWNKDWKNTKSISTVDLEYLFVRMRYDRIKPDGEVQKMIDFYMGVVEKNWTGFSLYQRSLIIQLMHDKGKDKVVNAMLASMREHATVNDEMGMYWANNRAGVFMSQSAVSVHTFIMDAFRVTGASVAEMDGMKRWLLKQKQTQLWESTHATADAVYALLSTGSDWFASEGETEISLGGKVVEPESKDIGTGYIKESWSKTEIVPEMGNVEVSHKGEGPAWGALYYQYFEEMDKIEAGDGSLNVSKELFVEINDGNTKKLIQITEDNPLEVGDKVVVRLTVRTDRDMQFVHLKDMRASAFEPVDQISKVDWMNGVIYYQTSRDASTNYYFDNLPRGTYLFEYAVYASRSGSYSNGITTIQSMYAPEFVSHTSGVRINVK